MRLAQLRKLGVIRKDAVIVQAFLEWGYPNLETVRQSMVRELRKCLAILMRMRTSRLDGRAYKDTGAARQKAIQNQLGRLDARFVGTRYQQSDELYATVAEFAELGAFDASRINAITSAAFAQMLPNYEAITSTISIDIISKFFQGLLGSPDEILNSAETRISDASERELRIARVNRNRMIAVLKKAAEHSEIPIPELANLFILVKGFLSQISVGPWAVMHFAQSFENCVTGEKSAGAVS